MFVFTLICAVAFFIGAIISFVESPNSLSGAEVFTKIFIGIFCLIASIVCGSVVYSYWPGDHNECESSKYIETEGTTATISIDRSGTYTIIGKDLDDDFIFVLEDKSGNRYVVNVDRKDYRKFETGDKLTCAFIEKISRDSGETLEYSNFEVLDTE